MTRTESTSSAQVLKGTQAEEFDLVIPGRGTASDETFRHVSPQVTP